MPSHECPAFTQSVIFLRACLEQYRCLEFTFSQGEPSSAYMARCLGLKPHQIPVYVGDCSIDDLAIPAASFIFFCPGGRVIASAKEPTRAFKMERVTLRSIFETALDKLDCVFQEGEKELWIRTLVDQYDLALDHIKKTEPDRPGRRLCFGAVRHEKGVITMQEMKIEEEGRESRPHGEEARCLCFEEKGSSEPSAT
jgi:hypothetical protein